MTWLYWALILVAQNLAFTLNSRARNSASVWRHMGAATLSNGVWFISSMFFFGKMMDLMSGKSGWQLAVGTGLFYTFFTCTGAMLGHHIALTTEKGKSSVGASHKYHQVTVEEWELLRSKGIV